MPDRSVGEDIYTRNPGEASPSGPIRTRDVVVALVACAVLVSESVTTTDAGEWERKAPVRVQDVAWGAVSGKSLPDAVTVTDVTLRSIDKLVNDTALPATVTDVVSSGGLGYVSLVSDSLTLTPVGSGTRVSPISVRDVVLYNALNRQVWDEITAAAVATPSGLEDYALDREVSEQISTSNPGEWEWKGPSRVREYVRAAMSLTQAPSESITVTAAGTGTRVAPVAVSEYVDKDLRAQNVRSVSETIYVREFRDPVMSVSGIPPGFLSEDLYVRDPGNAEHSGPIHLTEWVNRQLSTPTGIGQESAETPKVRESVVTRWDPNRKSVSDQVIVRDVPTASPTAYVYETLYTRSNPGQSVPIAVTEYVDRDLNTPINLSKLVTELISVADPTPTRSLVTLTQIDPVYIREDVQKSFATVTPSGLAKDLSETITVRESTTASRANAFLSASASPRLPVVDIVTSAVVRQVGLYGSASDTITVRDAHTEDLLPHRRLVFDPITVGESDRGIKGPTTGSNGRYAFRRRYGFRT